VSSEGVEPSWRPCSMVTILEKPGNTGVFGTL
jgi:hypothetical protein